MIELDCFKAYDIRGEIDVNINESIIYRIGRAVAKHFSAKSIVVGYDARETSSKFASAAVKGIIESGANALCIGLSGTEEMYWAVTEFGACAGIEITASHNPINYNGMKIVKSNSHPLDDIRDFQVIKKIAEKDIWDTPGSQGLILDYADKARSCYIDKVLSFIDPSSLKPLKIVINSGNGAAGPTFDSIAERLTTLKAPLEFIRVHHKPDHSFPNGIPNPILPQNHLATAQVVRAVKADFGVAFDGDFDRCFFFDNEGNFIQGEYIVGLLASIFLKKNRGKKIVHDPRIVWNTRDIISSNKGIAVQSKTGHSFIKKAMRENQAIYGGEISAHHYFQDFAYCDSGMIPWLLVAELVSYSGISLDAWVKDRFTAFPSSGEVNFRVDDTDAAISRVLSTFHEHANCVDNTDGFSLTFDDWRFNIRYSNTEPLIRLNIESRGKAELIKTKLNAIAKLIDGSIE